MGAGQRDGTASAWTRWRERRRVKRRVTIEREYHATNRLDATTRACSDADNPRHAVHLLTRWWW
jgi:hypothetical protein